MSMGVKEKYEDILNKHKDVLGDLAKNSGEEIEESSLSRIWQHVTDNSRKFAIISSAIGEYSAAQNQARHDVLKTIVRKKGYGFVETEGGYREERGEEVEVVEEPSLFIPEIALNEAVRIGEYFRQETVLYKDSDFFGLVDSMGNVGGVVVNFKKNVDDVLDLTNVEDFFTALVKGSHAGRKFVFKEE